MNFLRNLDGKKNFVIITFSIFIFSAVLSYISFIPSSDELKTQSQLFQKFSIGDDDRYSRDEQEFMMLRDPATNQIPANIIRLEQEFAKNLPKRISNSLNKTGELNGINALTWTIRGPNNVGGRTRALGIDVRTTSPPNVTIIAGGVSGGIWRSSNDGSSWSLVTLPSQLHNTTCIAQDKRSGFQDVWFIGSGETRGNSASGGGSNGTGLFLGDGIFKSSNNGLTWAQLPSTVSGTPQTYDNAFDYVHNVAVSQTNGYVFAAASNTIQRSTNGGTNWTTVRGLLANNTFSDVQITSTGVVYATISSGGITNTGIWRSTDNGTNWTSITPVGFPAAYTRIVIGISPSSENLVYFLAETVGGGTLDHSLWQYNSNGAGSWINRSANIPAFGGNVGNFNSQGAYDLVIKIKPDDPNFVLIGGTNLYRSTDGFSTSGATTWIGGYSPINDISQYPNHHPDQHAIVFLPGSIIITYSVHDGGISKTTDITTSFGGNVPVVWTSLNNSYYTTQFYSISLAPESGSNAMMGGLQDNSTFFGNAPGSSNWANYESGDGTIVEVAPLADDRVYTGIQNGIVRRRTRAGVYLADFTPSGSLNKIFVNPVVLDPNNSSLFYYAGGISGVGGVWRNSNVINATPTTGWTYLSTTSIGFFVTAVAVSTSNNANVVYFGSNTGPIRRIDNANTGSTPTVTDIKGTLPTAYVSCIAIDPTNSNNALLTFSNYNVQSLWYTTTGGTSWADVEGNLAGASGPSIRWASIFYVLGVPHYFIATSVGVFYTNVLNGVSTVWTQEAVTEIGNTVCTMLDWRNNDGTLAVATHGRGIFTTLITTPLPVELTSFSASVVSNSVKLNWETATEINNYGFEILRQDQDDKDWTKIGFVNGNGNSNSPKSYSFEDKNALSGKYFYRLKQIDNDGQFEYSKTIEVDLGNPAKYTLEQNYPNPFNPNTTIRFSIPLAGNVKIKLFDVQGQEVQTILDETKEAGTHSINFNAQNLNSGVYLYKIESGSFVQIRKMILIK